uniref:Uncharacterized protein n=1 Tax=Chromera velia CCMP2878 TaxID=1169474 RepID=A0A0G4HW15_9ALVE|eukprot:Cvel_8929.t1-p1 / transcript=Cvel_8929.t1 / gene=Cvel_8929 / organism=Chromera_velia_CCMP2878 / gene_product=hypothetical protein / transcript_product=hypothetical protein / location=Cvel_scaffold502:81974-84014(-) / protein_length=353 / sequence_SO=supercontig / SO=protein_coding / is_pseudo=false
MGGGGGASRSRGDTDQQPKGRKQEEAEEDKGVEEEGGQDDEPLWSYAVVTMESEGTRVEQVHHRMPLFLSPRTASMWLDPSVPFEKIKDEMAQEAKRIGSAVLEVIEVSDVVSSVRNNRRECVETREAVLKRQKAKGIGRFFTSTPAKGPAADTAQDRSKQQEDMQPSPSSSSSCSASAAAASVSTKRKQEEVSQDSLHRKDAPAPLASEDSPAEVHPYQKRIRLDAPLKEGDGNADEESGRRTEGEREGGHPEEDEVVQIEDDDAAPSPTRPGSSSTAHTQRASTNFPPDQQTSTRPLAPSVASRQTSTDTQPKRNPTAAAQAKPKAKAKSKAPPSSAQAKTILSFFKKTSS